MNSELLTIKDLHVYYGASHVLQGINISLTGGIHAVLGRNGMGKTTLCNAVMGLLPVRSGSIRFADTELAGLPPNQIAALGIGYTPQGRRLWPSLTVDEHLRMKNETPAENPWTPERLYETFPRLAERRHHGGGDLSGGEQQMLAIARALRPGPRLLIMDEPTEGLAPVIVEQLVEILRRITAEGGAHVLLVEQNLAVALALAEDISIMVNGRIAATLPSARMAADKKLQQRLLGVGRSDEGGEPNRSGGRGQGGKSSAYTSAGGGTESDAGFFRTRLQGEGAFNRGGERGYEGAFNRGGGRGQGGKMDADTSADGDADMGNEKDAVESAETSMSGDAGGAGGADGAPNRGAGAPQNRGGGRGYEGGDPFGETEKTEAIETPPANTYTPPPRWSRQQWETPAAQQAQNPPPSGTVLVAGTFDTKAQELAFLRDRLRAQRIPTRTADLSTSNKKPSPADIPPHHIAAFHPHGAQAVMTGDRGTAVSAMATAFRAWTTRHAADIAGIISAAGSGGTALVTPAMRALPIGVPKIMISTVASGDIAPYVQASDIMMMYSVTDVQGINRISARVLANGADALAGALRFARANPPLAQTDKPALGITMFGVTTPAVQGIAAALESDWECLVFHATGTGGRSMEKLAADGMLAAALDITTTEICDMMMGGVMPADENRFAAFARRPLPYVGSLGALDMVNWGAPETIPARYRERLFYEHNPQVTLMRTTAEENARMGAWIAERWSRLPGPSRFLLPLGGVSALDAPGQPFWDAEADAALFDAVRSHFVPASNRRLIEVDANINDAAFISAAVDAFTEIAQPGVTRHAT